MNRIVCDTNCLISGFLWNGAPARIIDRVLSGEDRLFISRELLAELAAVLCRPKFSEAFRLAGYAPQQVLRQVARLAVLVVPKPLGETVIPNDPSDEEVLACAVSADAQVIVSGDKKHLLPLKSFRGIPILTARQYLEETGGKTK